MRTGGHGLPLIDPVVLAFALRYCALLACRSFLLMVLSVDEARAWRLLTYKNSVCAGKGTEDESRRYLLSTWLNRTFLSVV